MRDLTYKQFWSRLREHGLSTSEARTLQAYCPNATRRSVLRVMLNRRDALDSMRDSRPVRCIHLAENLVIDRDATRERRLCQEHTKASQEERTNLSVVPIKLVAHTIQCDWIIKGDATA